MKKKTVKTRIILGGGAIDSPLNSAEGQKISVLGKNFNQKAKNHFNNLAVMLNLFQHLVNKHRLTKDLCLLQLNGDGQMLKQAFSVAEAMIALLIGSFILGYSAPIITSQIKHNNMSDMQVQVLNSRIEELRRTQINIPPGAIMAFNLNSCPSGWFPLTQLDANAAGAFIRNVGDKASAMGKVQLDAAPNITGEARSLEIGNHSCGVKAEVGALTVDCDGGYDYVGGGRGSSGVITLDASLSSASYGRKDDLGNPVTEVRPKNIAFLYCVKGEPS